MTDLSRSLSIFADSEAIVGYNRASLSGWESLGLLPDAFTLRLWNLGDSDAGLLSAAKELTVLHGDSVLASGMVADLCRNVTEEGTVTEIVFSAGLRLWEAPVSLSVKAGALVSETVRRILAASGTGIPLLSFPGEDPVCPRGQAFFGRAAECVEEALSMASTRCCLAPSGLCVIPASGLPASMELSEADLIDAPVRAGGRYLLLRTKVIGWPLGKSVSVSWKGETVQGLVTERGIEADNTEGNWQSELVLEIQN